MARIAAKKVKNATLWTDGTITIFDVRASYPHLDQRWSKKPTETKKFSVVGILPNATHAEARQLCLDEVARLLKEAKITKLKAEYYFVRDGDLAAKTEYEKAWTVNASEVKRPAVLHPDKSNMEIEDMEDTVQQPGCRIDMLIEPWWMDNEHGQRVNASLRGVRYLRMVEGEEIGEGGMDHEDVVDSFDEDGDGGFGEDDDPDGGL